MTVVPQNWYHGKTLGDFFLHIIDNVNGNPVFVVQPTNNTRNLRYTLEQMRAENVQPLGDSKPSSGRRKKIQLVPKNWYHGKSTLGDFFLHEIENRKGKPIFVVETTMDSVPKRYTLEQMRAEKVTNCK